MQTYNLALLGFGNVGQALALLLLRKRPELQQNFAIDFNITAIRTGRRGSAINPAGLDVERALQLISSGESLDSLSTLTPPAGTSEFLQASRAQVMFENTPVNYQTGQPAIDHLQAALELGMHAITANKGPVVHAYRELTALASRHGCKFYFESTVMDGAPVFSLFREALPGAQLQSMYGVLNSTTNMILTRMESGESFDQAVSYAQSIGIAETDPSGDVDGWDAAIKISALVSVLMKTPLQPAQVQRQGIRHITPQMVADALQHNQRYKLLCAAKRLPDGSVQASVSPELVPSSSPFFSVTGTTSLMQFETDVLGRLSVLEEDPGPHTTAYGLFADFLNAVKA